MSDFVQDGVDHINIYSKGKTELGRLLSNFARTPFVYHPWGVFESVEGFWYWYFTGCQHFQFKKLYGYQAKQEGQKYRDDRIDKTGITESDREVILEAIRCKLRQNKNILKLLTENTLPFAHYYEYSGKRVYKPEYDWIVDEITRINLLMRARV